MEETQAAACTAEAGPGGGDLAVRIDASRPLTMALVEALGYACDRAEDPGGGMVVVHVSGVPGDSWAGDLTVALVSKWERGLRRLERLAATTIAVATGDCGGLALDALLATDYRIATRSVRLLVPTAAGATWPGLGLYRLTRQAAAAARRAALFGAPISADTALALQVVDELTDDPARALAGALELASAFSGTELAIRRQLMHDAPGTGFDEALGVHLAACDRMLRRSSALELR